MQTFRKETCLTRLNKPLPKHVSAARQAFLHWIVSHTLLSTLVECSCSQGASRTLEAGSTVIKQVPLTGSGSSCRGRLAGSRLEARSWAQSSWEWQRCRSPPLCPRTVPLSHTSTCTTAAHSQGCKGEECTAHKSGDLVSGLHYVTCGSSQQPQNHDSKEDPRITTQTPHLHCPGCRNHQRG